MAAALVAAAEILARLALAPIGDYWRYWNRHAAVKFEAYREWIEARTVPDVVIVGDSTAAENVDPAAMADGRARPPVAYNLGWPANFALAFRDCTLPLLRVEAAPRLVVASFTPTGFVESPRVRRFEQPIVASPYCRQLQGEWVAADFFYLARLRSALRFRQSWWTGRGLPPHSADLGFIPMEGSNPDVEVPHEGHHFAGPRLSVLSDLVRTARDRDFELVVLIPPRLDPSELRLRLERAYIGQLGRWNVRMLDYRAPSFLGREHFYDRGHLNRAGARLFSRRVAADLAEIRGSARQARPEGGDSAGARGAPTCPPPKGLSAPKRQTRRL